MDLIDQLKALSSKVAKQLDLIQTEEATKNAFIMPFIKVYQIRIPSPPKCPAYPTQLLGNPLAYVVRDETCIHLDKLEEIRT
jgi:hypothetical protein